MFVPTFLSALPRPTALQPNALVVKALNAVLAREPWAQQRLAQYAGRTLLCSVGKLSLAVGFTHYGTVAWVPTPEKPNVHLRIASSHLSALPAAFAAGEADAILELVHIQGDAGMAKAIADLVTQLRLDPEAELARFTGDFIAVGLVRAFKHSVAAGQRTLHHATDNIAEYLGEESGLLLSQNAYFIWQERMQHLEQQLHQLEQRVAALPKG